MVCACLDYSSRELPMAAPMPAGQTHMTCNSLNLFRRQPAASIGVIRCCITRYGRPECAHGSPDVCMESSLSAGVPSLALPAQPLHPCLLCLLQDKLNLGLSTPHHHNCTSSIQRQRRSNDQPSVSSPEAVPVPCFAASAMPALGPLPLLLPRPFLCSSAHASIV